MAKLHIIIILSPTQAFLNGQSPLFPDKEHEDENLISQLAEILGVINRVTENEYDFGPSLTALANSLIPKGIESTSQEAFLPPQQDIQKIPLLAAFQELFTRKFWQKQTKGLNFEQKQEIIQRLVTNLGVFFQFSQNEISKEDLILALYSSSLTPFFQFTPEEKEKIVNCLEFFSFEGKKKFLRLVDLVLSFEGVKKEVVLKQLEKIFSNERYFSFFQDEVERLEKDDFFRIGQLKSLEELPLTDELHDYLLFLASEVDFLRDRSEEKENVALKEIFPPDLPLEYLVYLRKVRGLVTLEEVVDFLSKNPDFISQIDLDDIRAEIRKAIYAQAVEPAVSRRELLQNAFSAVFQDEKEEKEITVDFYYRNQRQELVEEMTDNGTGILNWLAFFVPGVSDKEGVEAFGYGFFGSGLFKIFEEADWVEVETRRKEEGGVYGYKLKMTVEKDEAGRIQGIKISSFKKTPFPQDLGTGTTVRIVRKTQNLIPELEAFVDRRTYLLMGSLAFNHPKTAGKKVSFYFIDKDGERKLVDIHPRNEQSYPTDFGEIRICSSDLPPTVASGGLRMSSLFHPQADYLRHLPSSLKELVVASKLSLILPENLPLIKDRSRLANEEEYIEQIRKVVLNDAIRRAVFMILGRIDNLTEEEKEWLSYFKKQLPEDLFTNEAYYHTFLSEKGKKAFAIASKINNNQLLEEEEIEFIQNRENLMYVLIGVEFVSEKGGKDSLLRRFILVQQQKEEQLPPSERTQKFKVLSSSLNIKPEETQTISSFQQEMSHYVPQAQTISKAYEEISKQRLKPIEQLELPPSVSPEEKEIISELILTLGLTNISFIDLENAAGFFNGKQIYLSKKLLKYPPRKRIEVIIHELAHYLEKKELNWERGFIDRDEEVNYPFTHQQDGSFAYYYRLLSLALMKILTSP